MENAQLVSLSRQMALQRELAVVANNIANVGTAGFKNEQVKFSEYLMPIARAETFPTNRDKRLSYVEDHGTWQDFSAGPVQITENQFDLAIDGDSFFAVQTPNGVRYTRNGAFQLDTQGTLVTNEGYPVMSTSGPIQFADTETSITIGKDGTVSTDQGPRGRLLLTRFGDPQSLIAEGSSFFRAEGVGAELAPGEGGIQQYALEQSNTKAVVETTRLVEINRAYQTLAEIMKRSDDLRRTAIERLGDVTA